MISQTRFLFRFLWPLLYIPLCIIAPIYWWNPDYGWSVVIGYWLPILILSMVVLPREEYAMRKAFVGTVIIMLPVTILFEYIGLYLDIWNFSEEQSKLWGFKILGAPVEEFVFWFGATPLCLLLYLYYRRLIKRSDNESNTAT
jgi:lycopene cyclase domain-containing protein